MRRTKPRAILRHYLACSPVDFRDDADAENRVPRLESVTQGQSVRGLLPEASSLTARAPVGVGPWSMHIMPPRSSDIGRENYLRMLRWLPRPQTSWVSDKGIRGRTLRRHMAVLRTGMLIA